ncbi:hypothetical protein JCM24511_02126 [Saitozyma sp. JCM 24511]|nr:hypothetical protein JCM24511_02126 [Saitozyma sp. JCM 24511]
MPSGVGKQDPLVTPEDDSAAQRTAKLVKNASTLWHGRNDADTRPRNDHSGLASSLDGMMET